MIKRRKIITKNSAVSYTLSSLIAIGITIPILIGFYYSIDTHFIAQDNPTTDLKIKSAVITESLISLKGSDTSLYQDWGNESTPANLTYLGFATSPTIEYGIINKTSKEIEEKYTDEKVGAGVTCFLAGTKIIMADNSYKNIEDIKIGEFVKSFDEKNQKIVNKKVIDVFHHNPNEMGDYYLIINDFLRVTPNHRLFTNSGWKYAGDLKVGDSLFCPSSEYNIFSIKRVYERTMTYNIEVEDNHNYFVVMNKNNVLVHNGDYGTSGMGLIINFKWFDTDGLGPGNVIFFNASKYGSAPTHWYWYDESNDEWKDWGTAKTFTKNVDGPILVKLVIGTAPNTYETIETVQNNTLNAEYIDTQPWVLTGKDVFPELKQGVFGGSGSSGTSGPFGSGSGSSGTTIWETFSSYGENYFVRYTDYGNLPYVIYEVKTEKGTSFPILDENKIESVCSLTGNQKVDFYNSLRNWSGLSDDSRSYYNYRFDIWIDENSDGIKDSSEIKGFGAIPNSENDKQSTSRDVLIYEPPMAGGTSITQHPKYFTGEITVSIFFGGTPPNGT